MSRKTSALSQGPFIYMSICHVTIIQFDWLPSYGNMYNLCKLHSLICMCSGMPSGCHSLSDCTFLYKYVYETSPSYKKKICDRVTGSLFYTSI